MGTAVKIFGRVRQILQGFDQASVGDDEQIALNEQLEQLLAPGGSPWGEIIRIGRAFEIHTTTPAAGVQAIPTTANLLSIWNGEPDGGRSLIIDRCWALGIATSATAVGQAAMIGCLGQAKAAQLTASALAMNARNGNGGKDSKVGQSTSALDAVTGVAANWSILPGQTGGIRLNVAATGPGEYLNCEVNGRIIVPPGRIFAVHVISSAAADTFHVGIEWHEKYVKLG
jgi:hypothetical protein